MQIVEKKEPFPTIVNQNFYILTDTNEADIQKVEEKLTELGFTVQKVPTATTSDLNFEEGKAAHFAINLSPAMNTEGVRKAVAYCLQKDSFLCFFGDLDLLLPEQSLLLSKIPCVRFKNFPIDLDSLENAIASHLREKKRILVVDDDPILLRSIKIWLGTDFEVSLVTSGTQALEFLSHQPTDLILLDYRMPEMDGAETLKALRQSEKTANIPVIFLTAKNDRESVVSVMQLKPQGYILKQEKPEVIRETLVQFFKRRIIQL